MVRDLDPKGDNVLTAVNFGRGLPCAVVERGAGGFGGATRYLWRPHQPLGCDAVHGDGDLLRMYAGTEGGDSAAPYGSNGIGCGADVLRSATDTYVSTVKYPEGNPLPRACAASRDQTRRSRTRIFYTAHGSFDTTPPDADACEAVSSRCAIDAFFQDLQ